MQQAVLHHFPDAQSTYQFTHRDANIYFTRQCYEQFATTIPRAHAFPHLLLFLSADMTYWLPGFSALSLTPEERTWIQATCPYFKPSYLDYLAAYRFKPSQVQVSFVPRVPDSDEGRIEIEVSGPWAEAIFWEVPLLATLSEIYFSTVDKDWNYEGQEGASTCKGVCMLGMIDLWCAPRIQTVRMRRAPSCLRRAAHSANSARVAGVPTVLKTL